ncbi:hypothetical protein PG985_009482 [Apiospora marii]|uniref:uncharacterized protein n=1 Tax=Apiospora marii TaxID=335849 RepID=UPI00312F73BD
MTQSRQPSRARRHRSSPRLHRRKRHPSIPRARRPRRVPFIGPLPRLGVAELNVSTTEAGGLIVLAAGVVAPLGARVVARELKGAAVEGVDLPAVGGEVPEARRLEVLVPDVALQVARAGVVVKDEDVAAGLLLRHAPDRLVDPFLPLLDLVLEDAEDVVRDFAQHVSSDRDEA